MNGVVRTLHAGLAALSAQGKVEEGSREAQQVEVALGLVRELLSTLPSGHELAAALVREYSSVVELEGRTERAERLRYCYLNIERVLDSCNALTMSSDPHSVQSATRFLDIARSHLDDKARYMLTRGDVINVHHQGAMLSAEFPNGMRMELSLRRSHPTMDTEHPEGHWVLEGGVWSGADPSSDVSYPDVDLCFGPVLPYDADMLVLHTLQKFTRACAANLVVLKQVAAG